MIYGIGIDVLKVDRIDRVFEKQVAVGVSMRRLPESPVVA